MDKNKIPSEEGRIKRNAYLREWRKNNKDKVKEINKRYWEKKTKITHEEEMK